MILYSQNPGSASTKKNFENKFNLITNIRLVTSFGTYNQYEYTIPLRNTQNGSVSYFPDKYYLNGCLTDPRVEIIVHNICTATGWMLVQMPNHSLDFISCSYSGFVLCDVLRWLLIPQRIQFKIAFLAASCVHATSPVCFLAHLHKDGNSFWPCWSPLCGMRWPSCNNNSHRTPQTKFPHCSYCHL